MLNHIIRLQAVVKIITNETTKALNLLARQSTTLHNAICQNFLASNYLLASEGRVYVKLNLNNCCLQINDFLKSHKKNHRQNEKACPCPRSELDRMGSQ
jgi:hypothetical protein